MIDIRLRETWKWYDSPLRLKQTSQSSQPIGSIIPSDRELLGGTKLPTASSRLGSSTDLTEFVSLIAELASHPADAIKLGDYRRRFGTEQTSMLVSVASLQSKARKKLGEGVWFVTPRSLQQATPWQVAQHKAKWFARRGVFDLCCGIGGDAVRFAQRGPVVAIDTDREVVRMTQANLLANAGRNTGSDRLHRRDSHRD